MSGGSEGVGFGSFSTGVFHGLSRFPKYSASIRGYEGERLQEGPENNEG
jgi:hypothetical protein